MNVQIHGARKQTNVSWELWGYGFWIFIIDDKKFSEILTNFCF